jgi:hypothetical protein
VRCPRCGNENSEENRFCGMCGAKLLPTPVEVASVPVQGAALRSSTTASAAAPTPARQQTASAPRPLAPVSEDAPFISGPSFLGLNEPTPRKRGNLNHDPHSSSSNLDYLLEEEEPRRGGAGKFILILLALALAVGFGYLRWKNQGLPWLHLPASKSPAAGENSDATDTSATATPAANTATAAPPTAPPPAAPQPAAQAPAQPAADSSPASTPPAGTPVATPDTGNTPASTPPATGEAPAPSDASSPSPNSSATTEPAAKEPSAEPAAAAPDTPLAPSPKPKKPAAEPAPKPHAGITPSKLSDPVSEAQKYIYGRGVGQDCERGMRLLKPAAAQANPKAMIEMGALYSAGLCTPHDLPTAYRWFAMALRKDPDNQAVQADLQKLWSEMTQPERQLAIKLSQ